MMSIWLKERTRWSQGVDLVVGMAVSGFLGVQTFNLSIKGDSYAGVIFIPIKVLSQIIDWSFNLPDEILVGLDIDTSKSLDRGLVSKYTGSMFEPDLFAGQGMFVSKPHLVNRGDSYEVHHVPEEWVDGIFSEDRGPRGSRFTHWLHTHPNAPAIPSGADADAAQFTDGVDMILGVWFSQRILHHGSRMSMG